MIIRATLRRPRRHLRIFSKLLVLNLSATFSYRGRYSCGRWGTSWSR
ncbi:hypothetical protein [Microlunatus sp. Gsoil 973]|nr:hypothetical protein [Microlunatus sp. Gsoil 973]